MDALAQLRRLWEHAAWADRLLLDALRAAAPAPAQAIREYAHVLGAEETWLSRIEGRPPRAAIWPDIALDDAAALGERVRDGYARFLAELRVDGMGRVVSYVNSAGLAFRTPLDEILLHVALHGQYHRGKVNLLLRQSEQAPGPVDFITFVRGVPAAVTPVASGRA
jgi:uncharacterized damage-inducible protein DinB